MGEPNTRVFPTRDEAIADAIRMCGPGEIVTVHEETCVLRIGATA